MRAPAVEGGCRPSVPARARCVCDARGLYQQMRPDTLSTARARCSLRINRIGDGDATALGKSLESNTSLKYLMCVYACGSGVRVWRG